MPSLEYIAATLDHKALVASYLQIAVDEMLKRLVAGTSENILNKSHIEWKVFEQLYGDTVNADEYFGDMTFIDLITSHNDLKDVVSQLMARAAVHDNSKFSPEEAEIFERVTPRLKTLVYDSEAYKASLAELGVALVHHYKVNDHHPEYFAHGIQDMNMVQLIEMVCDWSAAVKRMKDGNILTSLEKNKERFKIGELQYRIIRHTTLFLHRQKTSQEKGES
jgi:hypothetical protein